MYCEKEYNSIDNDRRRIKFTGQNVDYKFRYDYKEKH